MPQAIPARAQDAASAERLFLTGLRPGAGPCRDCHARDGAGGREGAAIVPPIDSAALTRHTLDRPAYDRASFARAVTEGRDAAGRPLAALMPRYPLDGAQASALWDHLGERRFVERRGVGPDAVVLGIDARAGADLAGALGQAMRGILGEHGLVHGRRVVFTTVAAPLADGPEAPLAVLFSPEAGAEARAAGIPLLFPLLPVDDAARPDEVRALSASRRDQAAALLREAPPDAPILADAAGRRALPAADLGRVVGLPPDPLPPESLPPDMVVIAETVDWPRLAAQAPAGGRIFALGPEIAPSLGVLGRRGLRLVLTDPAAGPGVDGARPVRQRLALAAARLLVDALVAAGRDLTRGSLMRGFADLRLGTPFWPNLDFARYAVTGTRTVGIVRLE
ncbi:hypothetical protein ABZT49_00200 [Methylobacterium sp. EM32]|uniref:hypothetical protein n=1 Tax=Methylobacterium sp. EM32 TaxID=3163481 RepID=UPI00339E4999